MSARAGAERTLTFRVMGSRDPLTGKVKNPNATLGQVAAKVARKLGIAGTFECLNRKSEVLLPETKLADLPDGDTEITLASDLTPA
jgi:hypothetical protein